MNEFREKLLLILLGGLAFGCSYTPGKQRMVVKTILKELIKLNKNELQEGIAYLYRLKYIDKNQNEGNLSAMFLTKKGKLKALNYQLDNIKNKKEKWDGKWRMVAFDIPNKYKKGRDALRQKLKRIGFCKLQESIFITPYNCKKEISDLVAFFELDKYVRIGILESIDNDKYFKKLFNLL